MAHHYQLYYWPLIPGRGEFSRLVLEAAGADYVDVARLPEEQGGGVKAMQALLNGHHAEGRPFAPPFLLIDGKLVWQSMLCAHAVACREGLVAEDVATQDRALAIAMTIGDLVNETHDTHHPVGSGLYYEEQKEEALRRAQNFREQRLPKFLGYFEHLLEANPQPNGPWLLGNEHSYPDLALFHLLEGLDFAFPNTMRRLTPQVTQCRALQNRVRELPRVHAYLNSERRLPFNQHGLFRHYPELDS